MRTTRDEDTGMPVTGTIRGLTRLTLWERIISLLAVEGVHADCVPEATGHREEEAGAAPTAAQRRSLPLHRRGNVGRRPRQKTKQQGLQREAITGRVQKRKRKGKRVVLSERPNGAHRGADCKLKREVATLPLQELGRKDRA